MNRSVLILLAVVVALSILTMTGLGTREHATANAPAPVREGGDVIARGRIEPQGGVVTVSGPPEGGSTVAIVDKLLVDQGSKVSAGQVVAVMNGYDVSRADYDVAVANFQVARLRQAQLQAGTGKAADIAAEKNVLAAREAQLTKVEKDWNRTTMLVSKNASSVQELDAGRATLEQIRQEVEQARNQIKGLTEVRPVDAALAAGQVAVAEAEVAKTRAAMERLQIRARRAGTILSIQTRSGESVSANGILRLGDLDRLIVVAEVDEAQVREIRLGMAAMIEGRPLDRPVSATVTRIANEVYRQKYPSSDILLGRDAAIVEVELTPQAPLPAVVGAEVTVRFTTSSAQR